MTEAVSEWLALDVRDIDEKKLLPGFIGKDGMQTHLPTQIVKIPFDDPDQVAVVSWRWDGNLHTKGSRNVASVIKVAKRRGIRYLFIDTISIDQTLPVDDLIEQVVAFSTLYTKITVLAAYDSDGQHWRHMDFTVLRPWILNEIRLFRQNSGKIIYVGHAGQGCTRVKIDQRGGLVQLSTSYESSRSQGSYFKFLLERIWHTTFTESIIGVLLEDVGMTSISDFKYILHAYSHILSVAYERMERNDYLLTTAILCRAHGKGDLDENGLRVKRNIEKLCYCRYSFTAVSNNSNGVWEYYRISLDGTTVAYWRVYRSYGYSYSRKLDQLPGTDRVILAALGLTGLEYEDFVGAEEARRACLLMDNQEKIPPPVLEVVEVDLSLDVPTV
ncbi:hypothetical protein AA0119_g5950 [Alternaria tenuissima]|jgi:hypothetical protein|uniref:Heterokaryon incompatibility domain-containing protein n=2 Tax=Alternaria alternata complex TaxID=187734 RepID=A0A4Q4N7J7_ALTAL|nr:hypothetical protein AA0115_g11604 [Alternaria tenuissima]RYN71099.1 hypothetical protein AA0117_g9869 [Alternaria alternata]RYO00634.1 hypothetical protein AA0119_g5950 [Alternaria tenuissima]RYO14436.1 hypothetical protein AA0121_g7705 [Alternaria tenuissima]RYO66638.1 hypothetical protein AA0116_g1688 [Alternaria tenuissima]